VQITVMQLQLITVVVVWVVVEMMTILIFD
jgi:hypothetical protein